MIILAKFESITKNVIMVINQNKNSKIRHCNSKFIINNFKLCTLQKKKNQNQNVQVNNTKKKKREIHTVLTNSINKSFKHIRYFKKNI